MPHDHDVLAQWYKGIDESLAFLRWRETGRTVVTRYYGADGRHIGDREQRYNGDGQLVFDFYAPTVGARFWAAELAAWDNANRLYHAAIAPDGTGEDLARYCKAASALPPELRSPALVASGLDFEEG